MTELQQLQRGRFKLGAQDAIRLLTIQTGDEGDTAIRATLSVASLQSKPKYAALSYQWGQPSAEDPVVYVEDKPVVIRRNLYAFLHHLRRSAPLTVWADSLCIDQAPDAPEKSRQIQLMGRIYFQAQRVLAWLGEHDEASQAVFGMEFRDRVNNLAQKWGPAGAFAALPMTPYMVASSIKRSVKLTFNKDPLLAWQAVLERTYFDRTWIIQELLQAREITFYCGADTMDKTLFTKSLEAYRMAQGRKFGKELLPSSYLIYFAKIRKSKGFGSSKRYHEDRDIFELIYDYKHTQCQDNKDRVYAVLSIETREKKRLNADIVLERSESIQELFVRVCAMRLPRKINKKTCEQVAKLFSGLWLDKRREDDAAGGKLAEEWANRNAELIIDIARRQGMDADVQGAIIRAFDHYGFLKPRRSYMITTQSTDARQIIGAYDAWRNSTRYAADDRGPRAKFTTLVEPIWARSKEMRDRMSSAQGAQMAAQNANIQQQQMQQQQIMQQNMLMQQQMQQQMMIQQSMMMSNPGIIGGGGGGA